MPVRPRRIVPLALACALAAAAPAAAEVTFTFQGRGFGHGVGMSQYGARGAALAGWDAERILAHYYRGAVVAPTGTTTLRVRVAENVAAIALRSDTAMSVAFAGAPAIAVPAGGYGVRRAGAGIALHDAAGREVARGAGPVTATASGGGVIAIDGRRYRGAFAAHVVGARLDGVNVVDLEDYLAGVLPREVPASWGDDAPAALDAQAIAARSYALASRRAGGHYDLHADVRSQVYGGRDGEDARTTAAVRRTAGRVLLYGGRVIAAYFSSSSGGRTEANEHVWPGEPLPYLRAVDDPWDAGSPYHRAWPDPVTVGAAELGRRFAVGAPVEAVRVLERGVSPRVVRIRLDGAGGRSVETTGAAVRAELGLRSTWFWVTRRGEPAAPRRSGGRVSLTAAQLRINQRISQAAVRRVNEVTAHLEGRPAPARAAGAGRGRVRLSAGQLRINQRISQAAVRRVNAARARVDGRPAPAPGRAGAPGRIRLSAAQLLVNQRISQAAVRRVNALRRELGLDRG
ncbi:SpoIID/LytB domain-containing protein [Miltoncostaea marina]|uniref:SpoIID/LytB domain-containing protein n=1 Tax=Miltoncostaea marina TaxID=2843215 RepID=UPI001C3E42DC|nr:SpoIID/LytB domain-containing protein [Miltoncostaea marina]